LRRSWRSRVGGPSASGVGDAGATLELAAERQAAERHVLERRDSAHAQDERLELGVLRRNAACLESLRRGP
jgi:prephenate dehydrogenase